MPDPLTRLSAGLADAKAARARVGRGITALEERVQKGVEALTAIRAEASAHRRLHRPGRAPKTDGDAGLQAFFWPGSIA
ncbi:hypothetical protein [Paenirhodobacter sp.]|jgi:hypothetical protein|uniref:hypothetical protein n=1 Tax=Paenirhodobacter sp. TaxID=1965326 RepID=UPI003B511940